MAIEPYAWERQKGNPDPCNRKYGLRPGRQRADDLSLLLHLYYELEKDRDVPANVLRALEDLTPERIIRLNGLNISEFIAQTPGRLNSIKPCSRDPPILSWL